ncbi:unnamed protein product, partial [Ectocarpus sp. 13 AM-2016]
KLKGTEASKWIHLGFRFLFCSAGITQHDSWFDWQLERASHLLLRIHATPRVRVHINENNAEKWISRVNSLQAQVTPNTNRVSGGLSKKARNTRDEKKHTYDSLRSALIGKLSSLQ